jgi:pyruvate-formate lyase-activating enzyme
MVGSMSLELTLRLVEQVTPIAAGTSVSVPIDGPDDLAVVQRWVDATGNTILMVHPESVEVFRGRIRDPIEALSPDRRPGHRLWIYTNFHCNLACDYCCVESSPRARPRVIDLASFARIVDEAVEARVSELFLTGGEPFMLLDLHERLRVAAAAMPTTVLTNAMLWSGERLRLLDALPRDGLTLQISLDSASPELHDRHRGNGSFARAFAGIRLALDLGFHVRVAATLGADAASSESDLEALFDDLGLDRSQRVVRRIARQGAANAGLTVSRASLVPEVCVTAEGVWWHPVAAIDPSMKVSSEFSPLDKIIDGIRREYRTHRITSDVLASTFPCA